MKKKTVQDIFMQPKQDRRMFPHVPDPSWVRTTKDRREEAGSEEKKSNKTTAGYSPGQRFEGEFPVKIVFTHKRRRYVFNTKCVDISQSGILVNLLDEAAKELSGEEPSGSRFDVLKDAENLKLYFRIPPGILPEGMEANIKIDSRFVRSFLKNGALHAAFVFDVDLEDYNKRHKDRSSLMVASLMLFGVTLMIVLMRLEGLIYFRFNRILYLYSIITAIYILTRYLFGSFYKPVPVDPDYTPGVSVIIPCFNEEEWIEKTIRCCLDQDYPMDKLEVLIVNDYSTDRSKEVIFEAIKNIYGDNDRFNIKQRVKYIERVENQGKREAMARGARHAKHDLLVFVDSDSFLAHDAIRQLVQPMKNPKIGGVSGRTDVANTYTNAVTKMQAVRYYIAFRVMKAAESYFDAVTCLSGPLACYRKAIVMDNLDAWLNQKFLGQRATFGDDRSMTNFILRKHRTVYQDTAVCSTVVPNTHKMLLKQQMRWKRSWLRESVIAAKYIWKKEPFMSLFFYMGFVMPILAPVVVIYNMIYFPIVYGIFPLTFLTGLVLLAAMMSFAQLFYRKSNLWFYGFIFCFYYVFILLWQMPVAWFTFWKSTWGTRMTPSDVQAQSKKGKSTETKSDAGDVAL